MNKVPKLPMKEDCPGFQYEGRAWRGDLRSSLNVCWGSAEVTLRAFTLKTREIGRGGSERDSSNDLRGRRDDTVGLSNLRRNRRGRERMGCT